MKKYIILETTFEKEAIEYYIEESELDNGTLYVLLNLKNKIVLSCIDDGNKIKFGKEFKKLDYSQSYELLILLDYMNKSYTHPAKYQIIPYKPL